MTAAFKDFAVLMLMLMLMLKLKLINGGDRRLDLLSRCRKHRADLG